MSIGCTQSPSWEAALGSGRVPAAAERKRKRVKQAIQKALDIALTEPIALEIQSKAGKRRRGELAPAPPGGRESTGQAVASA